MKNHKNGTVEDGGMVCTCCSHYSGGHGSWARGAVLRIALALFVSLLIFWLGVKVGEVKSEICGCRFNRFHGYYMMGNPAVMPTSTGAGPNVY